MRLSLNWLADFVDLTLRPQALADRLTMAGLEVEAVEAVTPGFSGVVVGKVLKRGAPPPGGPVAGDGGDYRQPDLPGGVRRPQRGGGVLYPFAPLGAILAGGHKLKPAKLRGVPSEGMLLAEDELGCLPTMWV